MKSIQHRTSMTQSSLEPARQGGVAGIFDNAGPTRRVYCIVFPEHFQYRPILQVHQDGAAEVGIREWDSGGNVHYLLNITLKWSVIS